MDGSGRVLIVDDDANVLEALSAALSPPYEVVIARTGVEALDLVQREIPDLVLLDYVLPDVSGLAILCALKQAYPSLPVILITGFGSEELAVASFRGGAREYLKKPIRVSDLRTHVDALLEMRRRAGDREPRRHWTVAPAGPRASQGPHNTSFRRAMAFIEAHLHTELRLGQVAREAGMSKFHFCRHFKDITGLTFREFLARRRIARAVDLLQDKSRSVSEVYLEVGFKDASHFSRVFRSFIGQSPSQYRRRTIPPGREG